MGGGAPLSQCGGARAAEWRRGGGGGGGGGAATERSIPWSVVSFVRESERGIERGGGGAQADVRASLQAEGQAHWLFLQPSVPRAGICRGPAAAAGDASVAANRRPQGSPGVQLRRHKNDLLHSNPALRNPEAGLREAKAGLREAKAAHSSSLSPIPVTRRTVSSQPRMCQQ